jgi:ribonuclease T1
MRRRIAVLLLGAVALGGCASMASPDIPASAPLTAAAGTEQVATALAPPQPTSDLPTMTVAQLPPEGIDTLELIASGGPFPYDQDGATFQNREGILPAQPRGFYAEYTVVTPGEGDRGARRIVAGDDGARFYTADHYSSFREVVSG